MAAGVDFYLERLKDEARASDHASIEETPREATDRELQFGRAE